MDHKIIVIVWQIGEKIKVTDGPQDNSNCMTNWRENKGENLMISFVHILICLSFLSLLFFLTCMNLHDLFAISSKTKFNSSVAVSIPYWSSAKFLISKLNH
jgi:hypothetical protein